MTSTTKRISRSQLICELERQLHLYLESGFAEIEGFFEQTKQLSLQLRCLAEHGLDMEPGDIPLILAPTAKARDLSSLITDVKLNGKSGYSNLGTLGTARNMDGTKYSSLVIAALAVRPDDYLGKPMVVAINGLRSEQRQALNHELGLALARLQPECLKANSFVLLDSTIGRVFPNREQQLVCIIHCDPQIGQRANFNICVQHSAMAREGDGHYAYPSCQQVLVPIMNHQLTQETF